MGEDQNIDQLYKITLDEFTAARNALAKDSGDAAIKKLEKPNLAAWAVNQLYWHERKLYDEVIKTSTRVRTAHRLMLSGKASDVRAAETFHAEAMRKAKDAIRRMLVAAGNSAADAVMTPVTETLDALPTTDTPGRLTRPLRRTGFEALQGVTITAKAPPVPRTDPKRAVLGKESDEDRRKRAAEQQALVMMKERLRFAEAAEREAETSIERASRALERAERTRERIEAELAEATRAEESLRQEQTAAAATLEKARMETARLRSRVT